MDTRSFQDRTTGDVVIRPGPPASNGGQGQGFFSIGGGGGFGGGFGGSSSKRRKKRIKARAQARARAQAEEQARAEATALARAEALALAQATAHRQLIDSYTQAHEAKKTELNRHFAVQSKQLAQVLQAETAAARKPPNSNGSERWQLYLITKERDEINGLIAGKSAELQTKEALAKSFDGNDPLQRSSKDYASRLAQLGSNQAINEARNTWESAYTAAHEAKLLCEAIGRLSEKSNALAIHHAEQQVVWRAREENRERQRLYAEQREARIRFKQQADEDIRHERARQANTLTVPTTAVAAGGLVVTRGGALVAPGAVAALEQAITATVKEIARIAALRAGQAVSLTATAVFYSPQLGNGELTPEQHNRLFQGVGVSAEILGLREGQDLQAIADADGTAELSHRLKTEAVQGGTTIIVATTGHDIPAQVPVRNAVFDPLTNNYSVDTSGSTDKHLKFTADAAQSGAVKPGEQGQAANNPGLFSMAPQVEAIPSGVDTRIDDCIVCIPGQPPLYFSFDVPPIGTGVVTGVGQPAAWDWWKATVQEAGAPIPAQIGDHIRGREFSSFGAFDGALWRAIAEDEQLTGQFNEVNLKRIENGFAPYAQKSSWVGDRREFEIRYEKSAVYGVDSYNLDRISITSPNSAQGMRPLAQPLVPWFSLSASTLLDLANAQAQRPLGNRTWTPLLPPGSEALDSTTSPQVPSLPAIYPGDTIEPVQPHVETLPGVDGEDINASIPGFGEDSDLPSPGVVFAQPPVKPLEVGGYNDLSPRSVNDGLDIDHIVSRKALMAHILKAFPRTHPRKLRDYIVKAPSIAIPASVHQKFSETYGGRNSASKQTQDAADIKAAVDSNMDAIKPGLLEFGFDESDVERAREQLHKLHKEQGWYE